MSKPRIKPFKVTWDQFFSGVENLETAPRSDPLINKIIVYPEVIPIIFVPGIMGSRLLITESQDKAWDPDALGFMGFRYGIRGTPEKRKTILVGNASHKADHLTVDKDIGKAPSDKVAFGWGDVAWSFCGDILKAMTTHQWPFPLNICFKFPVYAFGYNWTESNRESGRKLAEYIETVTAKHTWTTCKRVILVTHSMGGLVARSACKLHGAEGSVLGIVHGTQPATGSPAAYQRMKQGFTDLHRSVWDWFSSPLDSLKNKVTERVLGPSGQSVTIVMANMPGGLDLLPNQLYRTNEGNAQWLTYNLSNGHRVELPQKDPYREIYAARHEAFRLVNPAWLGKIDGDYGYNQKVEDPWSAYDENLILAKEFHHDLEAYCHTETYQFYATGLKTADKVAIASQKYSAQDLAVKHNSQGKTYFEILDEMGNVVDPHALWMEHAPYIYGNTPPPASSARKTLYAFAIEPPVGTGDGTVPDSSARALDAKPKSYTKGPDGTVDINENDESGAKREHSTVFSSRTAQQITLKAIENLCMRTFNIEEVVWKENSWMEQSTTTWKNLTDQIRQTDPPKGKTSSLIEEKEFSEIGKLCKAVYSYKDPRRPNRGYIDLLASTETTGLWITSFGKVTGKDFMYEKTTDLARAYRPPSEGEGRVAVLPDKDAFYLRYGAIDLPFEYDESVNILFRNHPLDNGLVLDVEMDVVQQVEQHGMMDRLAAMILTKFVPGLKIEKIRTRKRTVAGMRGEEVVYRGIEDDGDSGLYFAWEYPGQPNSAHFPNIQIGIRARDDNLAEKLALWDAVLDSLRPAGR